MQFVTSEYLGHRQPSFFRGVAFYLIYFLPPFLSFFSNVMRRGWGTHYTWASPVSQQSSAKCQLLPPPLELSSCFLPCGHFCNFSLPFCSSLQSPTGTVYVIQGRGSELVSLPPPSVPSQSSLHSAARSEVK